MMKNSKKIIVCILTSLLQISSSSFLLTNSKDDNQITFVSKTYKKALNQNINNETPLTYAQIGKANDGTDRLRFVTPVNDFTSNSNITYTRKVEGYDDKTIDVSTVYKSIAGENDVEYYYDGNELVTTNPNNDYYFASYVIKFSNDSSMKDKMFSVSLEKDNIKYPFLTTSYNALANSESITATFVDENENLLGRSIINKDNTPVYEGNTPLSDTENNVFVGWSDGTTTYKTLPAINSDTVFKATYENLGISVSEAILLKGQNQAVRFNGYVAGYCKNSSGNYTSILIQDLVTKECIELWANDHNNYKSLWNSYEVGDHVIIETDCITDNKGLPRAGSNTDNSKNKTKPVYTISKNNEITYQEITDMESFLKNIWANKDKNFLNAYTYTGKIMVNDSYFYQLKTGTKTTNNANQYLKIQFYEGHTLYTPTLDSSKTYTIKFVLVGYNKSLSEDEKNLYIRVGVMSEDDVEAID